MKVYTTSITQSIDVGSMMRNDNVSKILRLLAQVAMTMIQCLMMIPKNNKIFITNGLERTQINHE